MPITQIFSVWVDIPIEVHAAFHETKEYDTMLCYAIKGNVGNEYNCCSDVFQIAQFYCKQQAQDCENKLNYVVSHFLNKLKEQ